MRRYRESDLYAWGEHLLRLQDSADELGENILQKTADYGGPLDGGSDGHKVLCPEAPWWVGAINRCANQLERQQRRVVAAWYSAGLIEGRKARPPEVAEALGMELSMFNKHLKKGKKNLLLLLNQ